MKYFAKEGLSEVPFYRGRGCPECGYTGYRGRVSFHELALITGQKPKTCVARRSVSGFRLREGTPIGCMVTMRGSRMYEFLDRLISIVIPRIRDFRGLSPRSFDGRGNYTLGLREQLIFPEIDFDKIDKIRGFEVSINTTAETDEEARRLLELLGMPFRRQQDDFMTSGL